MEQYAVLVEEVTKRFGPLPALGGVTLAVPYGITFGLIGPGGSGKTTLIRVILGLLAPNSGRVHVLGQPPTAEVMRHVGYMPQAPALYQELTVRENVSFFGALYGSQWPLDETLALVELLDRADSPVNTLSGGMRQRASLACALVHRPRLLVLDEPTVGIDPRLRRSFWDHFHRLNADGVTIIVSSHVMDEAERCHRLGFLRDGRLLAEGAPDDLRRRAAAATLEEAFLAFAEEPS